MKEGDLAFSPGGGSDFGLGLEVRYNMQLCYGSNDGDGKFKNIVIRIGLRYIVVDDKSNFKIIPNY
jgi:hypothetical protein